MKLFVRDTGTEDVHYFIEEDNYSTQGNEAEVADLETCYSKGMDLVGSNENFSSMKEFKEFLNPHVESLVGSDYSTYSSASNAQKAIIKEQFPHRLVSSGNSSDINSDILSAYDIFEPDGKEYFRKYRLLVVNDILSQEITEADGIHIDEVLRDVKQNLTDGDWKTAKDELGNVVVDAIFTQARKDSLESDFQNYIDTNY